MKDDFCFVISHYRHGRLDSSRAYRRFMEATGQTAVRTVRLRRWIAAAAAVVVMAVAGTVALMRPWADNVTTYTSSGQALALTLPDGTAVSLAPHSSMSFNGDSCRRLTLRGTAAFSVSHDAARPFVVTGAIGGVKVLGTRFTLSENSGRAVASVQSGRIKFVSLRTGGNVVMTRGMKAVLTARAARPVVTERPPQAEMHTFTFNATPLGDVLSTLSQWYDIRLTTDPANRTRCLTGQFCSSSPEEIVAVIEQALDVRVRIEE